MSELCTLCGEPMPEGWKVFKYHGYSGPCPKPPLPKAPTVEQASLVRDQADDKDSFSAGVHFAITICRDRAHRDSDAGSNACADEIARSFELYGGDLSTWDDNPHWMPLPPPPGAPESGRADELRDAARYRWLRQKGAIWRSAHIAVLTRNGGYVAEEEIADAAIDQCIASDARAAGEPKIECGGGYVDWSSQTSIQPPPAAVGPRADAQQGSSSICMNCGVVGAMVPCADYEPAPSVELPDDLSQRNGAEMNSTVELNYQPQPLTVTSRELSAIPLKELVLLIERCVRASYAVESRKYQQDVQTIINLVDECIRDSMGGRPEQEAPRDAEGPPPVAEHDAMVRVGKRLRDALDRGEV